MNTITEETVLHLIEQVKNQQSLIEAQEKKILALSSGIQVSGPKPPKPEVYKGKRDAVEVNSWMDQIQRYGAHYGMSSAQMANLAVFYLTGPARDWWTNLDTSSKEQAASDWKSFCDALKASFYPIDHERKIMDSIEKLKQKRIRG